ncbi:MAG: response regulator [Chloroflexi bacterium]|nr:response regulator [Chloroflexota bacterium]
MQDEPPRSIVVVDDDKILRFTLTALLEEEGYRVESCQTAKEAMGRIITGAPIDVVVCDLQLPDGSGLQVLWALKKIDPDAAFILITAHASLETAIEAVNEGAFAYHAKPLDTDALSQSVSNAITQRRLVIENRTLLDRLQSANEELRASNTAELEEKNRELERTSQAKTQILSTVTHELKTPLTSIIGHVGRMLRHPGRVGPLNDRQRTYLETVHNSAQQLKDLIDALLDVAAIESDSFHLSLTDMDVQTEIEAVVGSMRDQVSESGTSVVLDIPSGLHRARADRLRFSQVMGNLLSNACKYSPPSATTSITAEEEDGMIHIDVSDTGVGISRDDLPRLFGKFFRVDNSSTREVDGIGLGLFITRRIVEAHGGTIWVESEGKKGSTFSFTIPMARVEGLPGGAGLSEAGGDRETLEAVWGGPK